MRPRRNPTPTTQVINRGNTPVIERQPTDTRRNVILVIAGALFIWAFVSALNSGSHDADWFASKNFAANGVELRQQTVAGQTFWLVTGKLVNTRKGTATAPDLHIKLVRPDGSIAGEDVLSMRSQIVPGLSALAFRARIVTAPNERVEAKIRLLKPDNLPAGKEL